MHLVCFNIGKYEFCANYIYNEHQHEEYEINYIDFGRCIMVVEGKNVTLRQGDCIIVSPQSKHSFIVDGSFKCEITQMEFVLSDLDKSMQCLSIFSKQSFYYKIANCMDVLDSMHKVYRYHKEKFYGKYKAELCYLEIKELIYLLSLHIDKEIQITQKVEKEVLDCMIQDIDAHYEQTISLEELAKKYKISSRYMRKLFEKYIGFGANEYIHLLRMERAKDLLKNSKQSISDISYNVGYNNLPYFSAMFKKKIGMNPKDFRNQYKFEKELRN